MDGSDVPGLRVVNGYRTDDPHPELRNNPMALDFPPPLSDPEMFRALADIPNPRPDDFASQSLNSRLERIKDVEQVHIPCEYDFRVLRTAISTTRASFIPRNPNHPDVMRFIIRASQGNVGAVPRISKAGGGGGLGILVTGPSGTGKTSTADRVVAILDSRARVHLTLGGKPCRWLQLGVIRVTVGDTWKSTLEAILLDIDSKLDRDSLVRRTLKPSRGTLLKDVLQALSSGFAPLLILDEIQTIKGLNRTVAKEILKGLINLMEGAGIPVMIVGTVAVRELFTSFPSQMGKFLNTGDIRYMPMARGSMEWSQFVTTLKEYAVSVWPIEYSETFDDDLFLHTMGVKRFVREYMKTVLTRHAEAESPEQSLVVDRALLDDIATKEMAGSQDAIGVLRVAALNFEFDLNTYRAYEDFLKPKSEHTATSPSKKVELKWMAANDLSPLAPRRPISISEFEELEREIAEVAAHEGQEKAAAAQRKASGQAQAGANGSTGPDATTVFAAGKKSAAKPKGSKRTRDGKVDVGPDDMPRVDALDIR